MIRLGLDFDNTIINYESLFHKVAVERGLIPKKLPAHKKIIRDFLIEKQIEEEFTLIQAEVYGKRILEAKPTKNFIKSIQNINKREEFSANSIIQNGPRCYSRAVSKRAGSTVSIGKKWS